MRRYSPLLLALLQLTALCAFVPQPQHQQQQQGTLFRSVQPLFASESDGIVQDPYESYVPGRSKDLAFKDIIAGDGEPAKVGDVLTVAYKGKLMSNGKQFDEGTGFSFKLGDGKVLKGWEQGLEVRTSRSCISILFTT